jgi:hypothetical protein
MRLIHRFILRLIPLGVLVGFGYVMFTSLGAVQSDRLQPIALTTSPSGAYNSGTFDSALTQQKNAGVTFVRETIDWSRVEPSEGTYDWSSPIPYAAVFAAEKAQGLTTVAVLSGGPTYLQATEIGLVDQTQFLLRWANFVQAAVTELGDNVDVWEIGNQLNTPTGMTSYLTPTTPSSSSTPNPTLYAQMLRVASKIIKLSDPNDEVWMGSLVSATSTNCAYNPLTFLLEVNGAKGWSSMDRINFTLDRGALTPEAAATAVNSACATALSSGSATQSGEVQTVQDLARQLGGKPVQLEGLGWSSTNLETLANGRSTAVDEVLADELTRATILAAGSNGITDVSWSVETGTSAGTALTNLNSVLEGAQFDSQPQGQSGSVYEYRFRKGSQWIIIAWRAQDGDNPIPVTLSNLQVSSLTAYAVDAPSFTAGGTNIPIDANGSAILMLNERPVVFLGKTADFMTALQEDAAYQSDGWKYQIKLAAHDSINQMKSAMLHAIEGAFDSAKEKALQWGEDKLNEVLN